MLDPLDIVTQESLSCTLSRSTKAARMYCSIQLLCGCGTLIAGSLFVMTVEIWAYMGKD